MSREMLLLQFRYNHRALAVNLEGIGHDESLGAPSAGGNCLNWVVGHIVQTRSSALHPLLGLEPIWNGGEGAPYRRSAEPLTDPGNALPMDRLLAELGRSQEQVEAALEGLTPEALARPSAGGEGRTIGSELALLAFHEAYHTGQTGLLRRLLGRPGAIR